MARVQDREPREESSGRLHEAEKSADAIGVRTGVTLSDARGRSDIDAAAVHVGADPYHHVVAKTEPRRTRRRFDPEVLLVRFEDFPAKPFRGADGAIEC